MRVEKIFYAGLLLVAAIIWGQGFIATKWVLSAYSPIWANALRYAMAGIFSLILLLCMKSWRQPKHFWRQGLIASLFLFAGMLFQIYGLVYTSVAKSGFLTAFYAFFIPIIGHLWRGQRYHMGFWAILIMALMGVALLCDLKWESFNRGDVLTLLCAISFALHIDYLGQIAPGLKNPLEFNSLQCLLVAVISIIVAPLVEPMPSLGPIQNWQAWITFGTPAMGLWMLGIFSSFLAFAIQVWGQKKMSAAVAGVIFLLESPFAAFFGWWLLSEQLSSMNIIGCMLVLLSVGLVPFYWEDKSTSSAPVAT